MAPSEGKNPRRFLSFDSLTGRASSGSSEWNIPPTTPALRRIIDDEKNLLNEAPEPEPSQERWVGVDMVELHKAGSGDLVPSRPSSPALDWKQKLTRPNTPDVTASASSSRARWDNLRQHVLPTPSRPATPPPLPPTQVPTLTGQTIPPRSQTPKPSRLARLGFRHVVEHAYSREVDETRKFSQELERVCWSIRHAEPQKAKIETTMTGSSLHLAFMSSASLTTAGASDNHEKRDMRGPHSLYSSTATYRPISSIRPLYQTLLQHATPSLERRDQSSNLPQESLVLSTLAIPFLSSEGNPQLGEERVSAIEAFELITRSWAPPNEVVGVERYLWCCRAASIPPSSMRTRVLSVLWGLLIPTETNYTVTTPECFQTLAQGLFSLLPNLRPLYNSPAAQEDVGLVSDIISQVGDGCCGELDANFVQEEYNSALSPNDDRDLVRQGILLEALCHCLEDCTNESRLWLFQNVLQEQWSKIPRNEKLTPLLSAILARTINGLSRALVGVLSIPLDQAVSLHRAQLAAQLLQERFISDIDALGDLVKPEARLSVVNSVFDLILMDRAKEPTSWGLNLVTQWYRGSSTWSSYLDKTLQGIISKGDWSISVFKIASLIRLLPDEITKKLVVSILPHLFEKLVEEPPPYPCIPLTNLLDTISRLYPQVFYKPLFLCAASSKEFTVVNHLCMLVIVSKFLPDYWIRDAEMISVALMSDGGKKDTLTGDKTWTKTKLGQAVVMLELIGCIQVARHEKDTSHNPDGVLSATAKFAVALESRLAILLEAKERTASMAPSQRLLFFILFREIRLLTRSLKSAPWLVKMVDWYIDINTDDGTGQDSEVEEKSTIGQIQGLYAAAQDGVRSTPQRRSTMLLSNSLLKLPVDEVAAETSTGLLTLLSHKEALMTSLSKGFTSKAMKLLVTMSSQLNASDYRRLCPYLWGQFQNDGDTSLTAAVCFMIMQCAERTPMDILAVMEVDLQSSNDDTKSNAVQKIGILFNWRYQILSQHVVTDRARRPFKLARGPLAFVSTDIGSSSYIREVDPEDFQDNLPAELRKRLVEIGWEQDDQPVDQHREWIKTPISLLSGQQIDRLENLGPDLPHPGSPSNMNFSLTSLSGDKIDETGLLRRNSSTGGPMHGVKRRAIFVPSLALVFPRLASLVFDPNLMVATAARNTIIDIMRNDSTLISRPVLDLFAGEQKDIPSAVLTINAFLHIQRTLPYPMTYTLFNNLAGFLKWLSRQSEEVDTFEDFALTIPIVARLAAQVSGLSIRDIRRAKIESFLIPSGSFWFPSSAPLGPMFPRNIQSPSNPFDNLPSDLVSMTIIRVSQNMLFLTMLKRNKHDVQLVRKSMSRLELPSTTLSDQSILELSDFVPRPRQKDVNPILTCLSLELSRSHVLLVAQIFRSMSRHLNDRNELAVLVDGLNRILLAHGDDIGIVSHVLIGEFQASLDKILQVSNLTPLALMVASTRFRRLFTSGGGYALFMPAVIKVYAESQSHSGIKLAVEYAVNRFYALHQEAFVFQTLDTLAHITALLHINSDLLVESIYKLFFTLRKGVLPTTPDAAAIHNANRLQEREALIMSTVEDKPQTFLSLLRRNDSKGEDQISIDLPHEYESSRLGIDDFVRLFLTVIAHDPSIVRAENFLRLLRLMASSLYHASNSARTVLQEGIDALGIVLLKTFAKPKGHDIEIAGFTPSNVSLENRLLEKSRSASNIVAMRLDYLSLIVAFTRAGGLLSTPPMLRTMELIKTMLKETPVDINHGISSFIPHFIRTSFLREGPPSFKLVVTFFQELAPLIATHSPTVDFSDTFDAITELTTVPTYANEPVLIQAVVSFICAPALLSCETAAAANILLSLPSRLNIVALIARVILLRGSNVISEVEKRAPTYDYLAGVVLPLTLSLKTETLHERDGVRSEPWHRDALGHAWVRLLSFAMSACNTRRPTERSRSQDRHRLLDPKHSPLPPFMMALQIIKIIVVRAEPEVSSRIPGIWPRLGAFLKKALEDGSANFASHPHDMSPLPSPTHSPRTSTQLDPFQPSASATFTTSHSHSFSGPRIIDYSLWSMLELICVYRSPLMLQMRLLVLQKLVELDHNLQRQLNIYSPTEPHNRRVSSSIFSKPRRRVSDLPSQRSWSSSPHLSTSQTLPQDPSMTSLEVGRQPGYNMISSPHEIRGPKIVHLGPISAISAFGRALSPGRGGKGLDSMATTTKIKSLTLVRATYKRIRTVQKCMGYDALLPMPQSHEMDVDELFVTTWTQKEALDAIMNEAQDLLEEFEESEHSMEDDGMLVDAPQGSSPRFV